MSFPSPSLSSSPVSANARGPFARLASDWRILVFIAALLFGVTMLSSLIRTTQVSSLPTLGTVPAFALTAETGRLFGTQELVGDVWVANFIFTRCPTVCPVFTKKMQIVQKRTRNLGLDVKLLSFSVDPDWDTPERLRAYAEQYSYNPAKWKFLTGLPEDIRRTVHEGLKIAMENNGMVSDVPDIIHGTHFVLVDQTMQIRGYYDSNDAEKLDTLIRDIGHLVNNTKP